MNRWSRFLALGAALLSACGTPHGQPHSNAESLAPNEVWTLARYFPQTAQRVTAKTAVEARRLRSPVQSIWLSRMIIRFTTSSPGAAGEPPCQRSRRAPAECSPTNRST